MIHFQASAELRHHQLKARMEASSTWLGAAVPQSYPVSSKASSVGLSWRRIPSPSSGDYNMQIVDCEVNLTLNLAFACIN
jgi:hypothetical protein